jgi:hypothetical protein
MLSVTIKSIMLNITVKSTMLNAIMLIGLWLDSNPGSHGQYKSALPQCYRHWLGWKNFQLSNTLAYFEKAFNTTGHIRHLCKKTIVLSCHRRLTNTGVDKINNI